MNKDRWLLGLDKQVLPVLKQEFYSRLRMLTSEVRVLAPFSFMDIAWGIQKYSSHFILDHRINSLQASAFALPSVLRDQGILLILLKCPK